MLRLFFNIIITMLYMGYTPLAWNPVTTPQIAVCQLSVELTKLIMFVLFCWTMTVIILTLIKLKKKQR